MSAPNKPLSLVERLVKELPQGAVLPDGLLDTAEKLRANSQQLKAATEEGLRQDRQARQQSEARARTRRLD